MATDFGRPGNISAVRGVSGGGPYGMPTDSARHSAPEHRPHEPGSQQANEEEITVEELNSR